LIDTTALTQAGETIASTYVQWGTERYKKAQGIVTRLWKLKDFDPSELAILDPDSSFIENAGSIMEATQAILPILANNPLVTQLLAHMKDEYNYDFGSNMTFANLLLGGQSSTLFQVCGAMLKFPAVSSRYTMKMRTLFELLHNLCDALDSAYPGGVPDLTIDKLSTIPPDVITHLSQARKSLAQAVSGFNPDLVKYRSAQSNLDAGIEDLKKVGIWDSMGSDLKAIAFRTAFETVRNNFKGSSLSSREDRLQILALYNTIKNTNILPNATNPSLGKARKAKAELDKILKNMADPTITQSLAIPQYTIALGAIRLTLLNSVPVVVTPPTALFPNSTVTLDVNLLLQAERVLLRAYNFLKYPNNLSLLRPLVEDALVQIALIEADMNAFKAQLDVLWLAIPGVKELIEYTSKLLSEAGLDNANSKLLSGDLPGMSKLNDLTGTSSGATLVALTTLNLAFEEFGLPFMKDQIDALKKKVAPKSEKDQAANKAKKKNKLANITKMLNQILADIDETQQLALDITGMCLAIKSMVE
jgi:hypothetical protein